MQNHPPPPELLSLKKTVAASTHISKSIPLHFYAAGFKAGLKEILIPTKA